MVPGEEERKRGGLRLRMESDRLSDVTMLPVSM
jgi:hypothetical protein